MKRSFFAIALMACAALASAAYHVTVAPIIHAYQVAKDFALDAFKLAGESTSRIGLNPVAIKLKFKAFAQRIEKRERLMLTSSWRMCPSI